MTLRKWKPGEIFKLGERVTYRGVCYESLQVHASIDTWNPADTPSLWRVVK